MASPGVIQKHLSLTFGRVSGLNFSSSKQRPCVPCKALPRGGQLLATGLGELHPSQTEPPSAHAGRPGAGGKPRGGARGDLETILRGYSLIPGRWPHPAKERSELEVPFQTDGSLNCIQTHTQPQKVSRLTLQSTEGLPASTVAQGSPGAAGDTAISRWGRAGRAGLVFGAPVGPASPAGPGAGSAGTLSLPAPGKAPSVCPARLPADASHF